MVSERIDHVAESLRLRHYAESPGPGSPEVAANYLVAAQVHATLALVAATERVAEQQRIANLIALVQGSEGDEATDYLAAEALSALVGVPFRRRPMENPVSADSIRGEIREALGL